MRACARKAYRVECADARALGEQQRHNRVVPALGRDTQRGTNLLRSCGYVSLCVHACACAFWNEYTHIQMQKKNTRKNVSTPHHKTRKKEKKR